MTGDVTWTDPPPVRPGRKAWVLDERQERALRNKPGEWALVRTTRSRHVKRRQLIARHPDGFDFAVRTTYVGKVAEVGIYARYDNLEGNGDSDE